MTRLENSLEGLTSSREKPKQYSARTRLRRNMVGDDPVYSSFVSGSSTGFSMVFYCIICHRGFHADEMGWRVRSSFWDTQTLGGRCDLQSAQRTSCLWADAWSSYVECRAESRILFAALSWSGWRFPLPWGPVAFLYPGGFKCSSDDYGELSPGTSALGRELHVSATSLGLLSCHSQVRGPPV